MPSVPDDRGKRIYVSVNYLVGAAAMWAVRLSPYTVPDNLEVVLRAFRERLDAFPIFRTPGYRGFGGTVTLPTLQRVLKELLLTIPDCAAWNERKNRRDGPGFVSAFSDPPAPDDDFIDLDALVQNIVSTMVLEDDDVLSVGETTS